MTAIELAKQALSQVTNMTFNTSIYSSEGGKCGAGWDGETDLDLSKAQLLYLISQKVKHPELFDGLTLKSIDLEKIIDDLAFEGSWPDGGPTAQVENIIPQELQDLHDQIQSEELSDDELLQQLQSLEGGEYTFLFTVVDGSGSYYFAEGEEQKITLTTQEVLGLLLNENPDCQPLMQLCNQSIDENDINDKAEQLDFASGYDYFSYGGECEQLDNYLDAWNTIISRILNGDITEQNLDVWLAYFNEDENLESDIEDWVNDID